MNASLQCSQRFVAAGVHRCCTVQRMAGAKPSQNSSGGKAKLGGITKRGQYLTLLAQGARSVPLTCKRRGDNATRCHGTTSLIAAFMPAIVGAMISAADLCRDTLGLRS